MSSPPITGLRHPRPVMMSFTATNSTGLLPPEHSRSVSPPMIRRRDEGRSFFMAIGAASSKSLLECFEYAARKYGIKHFVLDSMLKLKDVGTDDYMAQEDLLNRLNDFAKRYSVHLHIVCHSKKPDARHPKESNWPGEYDIKGSGSIPDLAWNVICMWRNEGKKQEQELAERTLNGSELEDRLEAIAAGHDALVVVQKQRTTGEFPIHKPLWFDGKMPGSRQFRDARTGGSIRYLDQGRDPAA